MESERRPRQRVAGRERRGLLSVVCFRIHPWRWLEWRRGDCTGGGELRDSAAPTAALAAPTALAAVLTTFATAATWLAVRDQLG